MMRYKLVFTTVVQIKILFARAPSCLLEDAPKFFEQDVADPFMLKVCNVRPEQRNVLPAIAHVDGTARLQTVHPDTNPRYYRLLKAFEQLSGVPVLLNTSFNVMGEPIVESPIEAIHCFFSTGLDYLVLGDHLLGKRALQETPNATLKTVNNLQAVKLKAFNDKYYLSVRKRAEFLARYSAGSIGMNLMGSEV